LVIVRQLQFEFDLFKQIELIVVVRGWPGSKGICLPIEMRGLWILGQFTNCEV